MSSSTFLGAPRWVTWVGRAAAIEARVWPWPRTLLVVALLLAAGQTSATLPTSLLLYAIATLCLDGLATWRDADLSLMLERGRQCAHHQTPGPATANDPIIDTGHAFTAVACGAALVLHTGQMIAVLYFAGSLDAAVFGDATAWLAAWCCLVAVLDVMDEVGRAAIIRLSYEADYVNARLGRGAARYEIHTPHPNWHPTRGYHCWKLARPVFSPDDEASL